MGEPEAAVRGRIGMRIRSAIQRPEKTVVEALARLGTDLVADGMNRFGALDRGIRSLRPGWCLAGPATTVRARPADNLMIMRAIDIAEPGDVLVVATGRHRGNAVWGELMTLAARKRGLAGIVTDGAVRDLALLQTLGFPVFAAGVTPIACDKDGPGEINFPIAVGDVPVMPGDIIVGDDDGVVVVPPADVDDLMRAVATKQQSEERRRKEIEAGIVVPAAVIEAVEARLR